ncbi:MAG: hypothetical protein MEQ74_05170 [Paracoccus sp.]|nr:hypothetical protein [Paracoccus sp. (in: a-proteobacteria)]
MAHFAEIGPDDTVLRVLVVPNEKARWGQKYLAEELGLGGEWLQCSYNENIRGKYPGIGDKIDRVNDVFYTPAVEEVEQPAE